MAIAVICDFCKKPLEIEDGRYVFYRTKRFDTCKLLPYLCKNCAEKLDDIFEVYETRKVNSREVIAKFRELNQARRERLGTKG